jgi:hypothetical protein
VPPTETVGAPDACLTTNGSPWAWALGIARAAPTTQKSAGTKDARSRVVPMSLVTRIKIKPDNESAVDTRVLGAPPGSEKIEPV